MATRSRILRLARRGVVSVTGVAATAALGTPTLSTGGEFSNVPAGYSLITSHDNSNEAGTFGRTWSRDGTNFSGNIFSDPTAPQSPQLVMRQRFNVVEAAGVSLTPAPDLECNIGPYTKVYRSDWVKCGLNYKTHSTLTQKTGFIWVTDHSPKMFYVPYSMAGETLSTTTPLYLTIHTQGMEDPGGWTGIIKQLDNSIYIPNQSGTNLGLITRGQWHRWEWLCEMNTGDNYDGVLKVWLDGVLVHSNSRTRFASGSESHTFDYVDRKSIWGGSNNDPGDFTVEWNKTVVYGSLT